MKPNTIAIIHIWWLFLSDQKYALSEYLQKWWGWGPNFVHPEMAQISPATMDIDEYTVIQRGFQYIPCLKIRQYWTKVGVEYP